MRGKGLLSSVLLVCLSSILCLAWNWYLVIVLDGRFLYIFTEEEASMLRFFVDQPAFTDLHWVRFN